jgi:hypothetical protein
MFLESCSELGISLSEDLSEKIIIEAYNKQLSQHSNAVLKGLNPQFELQVKIQARDYLLDKIKPKK